MGTSQFSDGKRDIFLKVKEIKRLRGGVAIYAAQANVQIDAEIVENGRFLMETDLEARQRDRMAKDRGRTGNFWDL
jgi:hypothetical protein